MNTKILVAVLIAISFTVILSAVVLNDFLSPKEPKHYEFDFTYSDINKIKKIIMTQDISMSTPVEISDRTVKQYCSYFDDNSVQRTVEYCSTTALLDSNDVPLGNINIGGSSTEAFMGVAIIDASPQLNSKSDEVHFVFNAMIDTLVCDCWEDKQPGGFESISHWIDTAEQRYLESGKNTLKSSIEGLDKKKVILEITSKSDESYIWTLVVVK